MRAIVFQTVGIEAPPWEIQGFLFFPSCENGFDQKSVYISTASTKIRRESRNDAHIKKSSCSDLARAYQASERRKVGSLTSWAGLSSSFTPLTKRDPEKRSSPRCVLPACFQPTTVHQVPKPYFSASRNHPPEPLTEPDIGLAWQKVAETGSLSACKNRVIVNKTVLVITDLYWENGSPRSTRSLPEGELLL